MLVTVTLKNTKGFGRFKGFVQPFSAVETFTCIRLRLQLHILWFISLIIPRIENASFKEFVEFARDLFLIKHKIFRVTRVKKKKKEGHPNIIGSFSCAFVYNSTQIPASASSSDPLIGVNSTHLAQPGVHQWLISWHALKPAALHILKSHRLNDFHHFPPKKHIICALNPFTNQFIRYLEQLFRMFFPARVVMLYNRWLLLYVSPHGSLSAVPSHSGCGPNFTSRCSSSVACSQKSPKQPRPPRCDSSWDKPGRKRSHSRCYARLRGLKSWW